MDGTLLAVCALNTKLEEAETYFNWMKDEGHSPNVFHYSSLLNAYLISGNCRKADELVQDMKSAGLVPNKVILTTLFKVYVRGEACLKNQENYWLNWKLWPMRMKRFISRPLVFCKVVKVWKG
ncbi:pentatricopeptide repeat-containing protein At5g46580, chloroplastic-like isoform X2 [Castanea sativa]|uniref:pentatricopeptide repeat-containing protein At5g46580, chloroplastic-like isoform X2 n=1 Tax=Castanea sativa TaxID=21020 RepID=UPI003F65333B